MKRKVYIIKTHSVEKMRNGIIAVDCDEKYGDELLLKNTTAFFTEKEYRKVKKRKYYWVTV